MVKAKAKKKMVKKKSKVVRGKSRKLIRAVFSGEHVSSASKEARDLYSNRLFGEYVSGKINYSFVEALYLLEKKKIEVYVRTKKLGFNELMEKCKRIDKKVQIKFIVYKDLRNKGYLLKTALKFGADFRVYDKGERPGKKHARWILYPVSESSEMTWHDFSAKNRVAHSTKKNLLIAVVEDRKSVV